MEKESKKKTVRVAALGLIFCSTMQLMLPVAAQEKNSDKARSEKEDVSVVSSQAFLEDHPDMHGRLLGMNALRGGKYERAADYFLRGARYGDKQSQAMYAEMLWVGRGVPKDRVAAYVWMDLAAERGYQMFLVFRERYWAGLDEAEQQRALVIGEPIYAEYGDKVAKPRLERMLRRAQRSVTGSRTGFTANLQVIIPGLNGDQYIDGSDFYDPKYWEPEQYWRWQAEAIEGAKAGKVIVGDLKHTEDGEVPPKDQKDSDD